MSLKEIITIPNSVLASQAELITNIDDRLVRLAIDMAETMYKAPGIGLAANQVGELIQLIVLDVVYPYTDISEKKKQPVVLINPEITLCEGETEGEEGCLSVPDFAVDVKRSARIQVKATNLDGDPVTIEADGLLARALQHEIDHLRGVTILEHATPLRRNMYTRKAVKKVRRNG